MIVRVALGLFALDALLALDLVVQMGRASPSSPEFGHRDRHREASPEELRV